MGKKLLVTIGTAACLALPGSLLAQGLGDAAKKEKERRSETSKKEPGKTYTQEDVYDLPPIANDGDTGAPTTSADVSPVSSFSAPVTRSRSRGSDETLWRGRVTAARQRVTKARATEKKLAGMHLVPGYEYRDNRGRVLVRSVEELQAMASRAKAEVASAEKALADLLESGRRAGVPPGWLR